MIYFKKSYTVALKIKDKRQEGLSEKAIGKIYLLTSKFDLSTNYYNRALEIFTSQNNKPEIADCYFALGRINATTSNYVKGLDYLLKATKLNKEINRYDSYILCLSGIGIIYKTQNKFDLAEETYRQALKLSHELNIKSELPNIYANLGSTFFNSHRLDSALKYQLMHLKLAKENDYYYDIGIASVNLAITLEALNEPDNALSHLNEAEEIFSKTKDSYSLIQVCLTKGNIEFTAKKYSEAKRYYEKALMLSQELGVKDEERGAYGNLAQVEYKLQNYKAAFQYQKKHKAAMDSIFNEENSKQLGDLKTNFEVEKKEAELKLKSDAEKEKLKAISTEEKKRQTIITSVVIGVLIMVIIFSVFLYRRFALTQKQKQIIEIKEKETQHQKLLIEEKQKEIIDSIHYAKRIQLALLPTEKYVERTIKKLHTDNEV